MPGAIFIGRRRALSALAAAIAAVLPAWSAPPATPRRVTLFFFGEGDEVEGARHYRNLLEKEGFVEPRNLALDTVIVRTEAGLDAAARRVVASHPDLVILGWRMGPSGWALRAATRDIPVVFTGAADPVRSGLVESLRRPGRNFTGSSASTHDLIAKRLELFRELRPDNPRLAVLVAEDPDPGWESFSAWARDLAIKATAIGKAHEMSLQELASALRRTGAGGFMSFAVAREPGFWAELQARSGVPGVFTAGAVVKAGGLSSLGVSDEETARRAVAIAARILRGEHPSDIPVDQANTFDLAVNLGTARAMGIRVPPSILIRATTVYDDARGT